MRVIMFLLSIKQTGEPTPNSTGYLEVQIVGGKLLHSKKVLVYHYFVITL